MKEKVRQQLSLLDVFERPANAGEMALENGVREGRPDIRPAIPLARARPEEFVHIRRKDPNGKFDVSKTIIKGSGLTKSSSLVCRSLRSKVFRNTFRFTGTILQPITFRQLH